MNLFEKIKNRIYLNCETILHGKEGYKMVNEQMISYTKVAEIINEVEAEHGWIPVEKSLPEDGVEVLVWFEYFRYGNYNRLFQTQGISYTYDGKWSGFVNGESGWQQLNIIAWMPLPEPYRPKEE